MGIYLFNEMASGRRSKGNRENTKSNNKEEMANSRNFCWWQSVSEGTWKGHAWWRGITPRNLKGPWDICVPDWIDDWTELGLASKTRVPPLVILPQANHKITLLRFCFNPSPWSGCTSIPLMTMELSMIQDKNNWLEHCKLNQKIKSDNHKFHLQLKPYLYNCQSFQLICLLWNLVVRNNGDPSLT